ncbi:MAG: type II toxin-antitoxin system VapC family toxin [Myxococcales bacterium]|nr:type II toxin-antitoxin system VapC family toxin [Myxococcales bacterium]
MDTNVLCEPTRKRPSPRVTAWLAGQEALSVSVVSLMEIEFGVERSTEQRRKLLQQWFEALLASPAVRVVPIDTAVARAAGRLRGVVERQGRPRSLEDLLVAATAQISGSIVATRNTGHFDGLGVSVFNPFA